MLQVTMLDTVPELMNAIRMINSYSRYYNTSEHMTALFVKVTNQMITACKNHITDNGYRKVSKFLPPFILKSFNAEKPFVSIGLGAREGGGDEEDAGVSSAKSGVPGMLPAH